MKTRRCASRLRAIALTGLATMLVGAGLALPSQPASAADPGVEPPSVLLTLGPGGSASVNKVVHTAPVPPTPDVVLLADTTGSMGSALDNVHANVPAIVDTVTGAQSNARFAVAEYKDFGDPFAFRVNQALTANETDIQQGVDAWLPATGGGDTPESWINALFEVATGAIAFRPGSTKIVAIFGDAPSHDPSGGHTLAAAIQALTTAGIRVVAINVPGSGGGLNANNQATQVTAATGGVFRDGVEPGQVAQAILAGIQAIKVTVAPTVLACDTPLSLAFNPTSVEVESGDDAHFTETVAVAGNAAAGTYHCAVDFKVDGASSGFIQQLTVVVAGLSVNDVTVPEAGGPATFSVTLSAPSPSPVTVQFATANGTATAPADYTTTSVPVTFLPGQTTRQAAVPIVNDAVDEPNETFTVKLSAPVGAALIDPNGVGTIVDDDRDGVFSCQATVLRVAGLTAVRANPPNVPCVDDSATLAQVQLSAGLVTVRATALHGQTNQTPDTLTSSPPAAGDNATSTATVETTKITALGLVTIELGVISSSARATCVAGPGGLGPMFAGTSTIASLKINGATVPIGSAPVTIPLVVGTLSLNSTVTNGVSVVQRAVVLHTALVDVVIGEAKADVTGSSAHPNGTPCRA
jgi:hypothetical protein